MFDMFSRIVSNLMGGPATRLYPVTQRETYNNVRGQLAGIDEQACVYCGLCQRKCPALAITVDRTTKTWKLDPYKCVVCGVCQEACPKGCMNMATLYRGPVRHREDLRICKGPEASAIPQE